MDLMTPHRLRSRQLGLALICAAALACSAACGTRLSDAQIAAGAELSVPVAGPTANDAANPNAGGAVAPQATVAAAGPTLAAAATGPAATAPTAGAGHATVPAGSAGGAPVAVAGAVSQSAPCTSQGAPVIIGQDGAYSGLVGQAAGNIRLGMSVWAKWVNSVGGVACHPVQLYQEDDNSDPAKASSDINDLVKNKHAIALVGTDVPIVVAAAQSTAQQLHVPIVGGDVGAVDWYQDPNTFPSGGYPLAVYGAGIKQAVSDTGKTKIALLYCVEASTCGVIHDNFGKMAGTAGATVVDQQSMSLTQTAYSAECQNAQNAGAQLMFISADGATVQRVVKSCVGIGYKPVYVGIGLGASAGALNDPNVRAATLYFGTSQTAFVANDTPALQTFHNAFKTFTGSDAPDEPSLSGWAAGMLFKAAIDALGTSARNGPITTAMVYDGLDKLQNQTLGGLIGPISFTAGKPPSQDNCFGTIKVTDAGLTAPTGSRVVCN
jgi:branched-chain amino acid transport system substrate-binding protein